MLALHQISISNTTANCEINSYRISVMSGKAQRNYRVLYKSKMYSCSKGVDRVKCAVDHEKLPVSHEAQAHTRMYACRYVLSLRQFETCNYAKKITSSSLSKGKSFTPRKLAFLTNGFIVCKISPFDIQCK